MPARNHLIVVRHGRTAWNAAGRFQGQADPPLDSTGLAQAREAAGALLVLRPGAVISSDLRRAHGTARCVAAACGLPIRLDRALREQALGTWEGLDRSEAAARHPDEYVAWSAGRPVRRGGGETEREAGARACPSLIRAMQEVWDDPDGRPVVVVSHGLVLRAAMTELCTRHLISLDRVAHLDNGQWLAVDIGAGAG
jgi:broad specificity phosphatase PhoE